jgi:3-isopropylmalate/(R)-2-methylmalate dehydratase large subunit
VECGARGVVMAPDRSVFDYLADKPRAPKGTLWEAALAHWGTLRSDADAVFDREVHLAAEAIEPMVTWGTSPDQGGPVNGCVPDPEAEPDTDRRRDMVRALAYMDLKPGTPLDSIPIQRAFIGSCTNARLSDLREAAALVRGRRVAAGVQAMVVPGSSSVRRAAEAEGLDRVFLAAGFEWRQSGCSMCLAMNDDVLAPGERCASSTNRNFEGRQGAGGRTHLMSPAMVAAAAIAGHLTDSRRLAPEH